MRLHHGSAVLHCVMFAVAVVFLEGVLSMVFTKWLTSFLLNTECPQPMSQGKNLLHTNCIFTDSAMYYENLQLFLGNYNLKFGENG